MVAEGIEASAQQQDLVQRGCGVMISKGDGGESRGVFYTGVGPGLHGVSVFSTMGASPARLKLA